MVNTTICWDCLSMEDSHPMPTISFWVTMWTEVSKVWKLSASCLPTKSSTQRTSSCSEATTSVHQSIVSTGSMMNAKEGTTLRCGKLSLTVSTVYPLLQSSMKKSCVCMEDSAQNWAASNRLRELWDLLMFQIQDSSAISYGQILTRMFRDGVKMTEVSVLHLDKRLYLLLIRNTILIWSAELIRSLKTAMNSLQRDNLWLCSVLLTTVVNSIMREPWCPLMIHSCAVSRSWSQLKRNRSSHMEEMEQVDQLHHQEQNIDWLKWF